MKEGKQMKNEHVIKIKVEGKDWQVALDKAFKKVVANVTVAGFRKGKIPKDIYIKKFGKDRLYVEAIDIALPLAYEKVLNDEKLVPECQPQVEVKNIDDEGIEFEFTIITKPEVKVSKYKGLKVKKEEPKVTKTEIKDEIERLRGRFAEVVAKKNGEAADGDIVNIDFEGSVDGKPFEGGSAKNQNVTLGGGMFIPGFEEGILGMKVGETKDVEVTFPEDYMADLAGKKGVFKITLHEVKARVLPKLDEEFFEDLGYEDVKTKEELEKKVEENLLKNKTDRIENQYISDLIDAGIENMTVEVNDAIVDEEVKRMIDNLSASLKNQGLSLDQYLKFTGSDIEKIKDTARPEALKRIKSRYLLDEIVKKEKIGVSEAEVIEHAKKQAEMYGVTEDEIVEMYGGIDAVKYDLLVHKAIDILGS